MGNPNGPAADSFIRRESITPAESKPSDPKKPDLTLKHFSQLTPENVRSTGNIKGMAFDVDDTLSKFQLGNRSIPPELIKQLKTLQDSGIKLGIVTNNPSSKTTEAFQKELSNAGIHMDAVIHADKPNTKGLEMLQKSFGLPANQMMMVGDQGTDVQVGKRAGFKTAQVDWFGNSSFHKKLMHKADEALNHVDKTKATFDSDPDQPEYLPTPQEVAPTVMSQAG